MTDKEKIRNIIELFIAWNGETDVIDVANIDSAVEFIANSLQEEPVSNDLEDYINELSKQFPEVSFAKLSRIAVRVAKWQNEQFEKNRLAACDRQTEEEAEIERDFVTGIIDKEHRLPTFDDAIKYGMRLKEKEMQSTIELAEDHAYFAGSEAMREKNIEGNRRSL